MLVVHIHYLIGISKRFYVRKHLADSCTIVGVVGLLGDLGVVAEFAPLCQIHIRYCMHRLNGFELDVAVGGGEGALKRL